MSDRDRKTGSIAFHGNTLDLDREAFLSRHDVVYRSPAAEGYDGFPIGNGDLGAMAWTPPGSLHFQINKTNTWDDAAPGLFGGWQDAREPDKAERYTSLRSCGELRIEPGLPVFDWMYLTDFEGRLSLSDATATWRAEGPFGTVSCSAMITHDPAALVVHYEDELTEEVPRRIVLGRWGSRVFEHWYRFVRREFFFGFADPVVGCGGDEAWVVQETRSLGFALAAKIIGGGTRVSPANRREVRFETEPCRTCAFDLFVSAATSEEAPDPLSTALETVRAAADAGSPRLREKHRGWWSGFWSKSFVRIPDDYLENLWYLNVYQIGSSSLGDYPPHFIGSIWSWNRDFRPWNHYFQWNQQHYTWPLHASGHPELMMPYARWKLESLEGAKEAAVKAHGCEGAFYSDISDRRGNQAATEESVTRNLGATILTAVDLLRHYEYTLDAEYLRRYAFPVIQEIVRFYTCKLRKGEDGLYHVPEATPNEGHLLCSDTTNDLAGIRKVFPAYVEIAERLAVEASGENAEPDMALCERAREIVANLAPYPFTEVPEGVEAAGGLRPGDPLIAFGIIEKTGEPGHPWVDRPYWAPDASLRYPNTYHAVNAQLMPVFPANLVGRDDRGTPLYEACRNAALAFDPVSTSGHTPLPICYARLGLIEALPEILARWVDDYQLFSQGLFCYFKRDYNREFEEGVMTDRYSSVEHNLLELTNTVSVIFGDRDEKVELLRRPFAHVGLEAGSVLETVIDEMLLQSYDGKIRVFPAVPEDWECAFTLHAVGAFEVTSERVCGTVAYVAVQSGKGLPCLMENPWRDTAVRVRSAEDDREMSAVVSAEEIRFATEEGHRYVVERVSRPLASFEHCGIGGTRNLDAKTFRRARLGIPRRF